MSKQARQAALSNPSRRRAKRIFISHSWRLSSHSYREIAAKFKRAANIYNHSIPQHKARPIASTESIRTLFHNQLLWCSKVFVVAHQDLSPTGYVAMELDVAAELGKEIIAIQPAQCTIVPRFIQQCAHRIISDEEGALLRSIY